MTGGSSDRKPVPRRAVAFDLDGTLTLPALDFELIRREIGEFEGPILEALDGLPPARRARAIEVLERHEARAAAEARLRPHASEVLHALREHGVPTAILTRNSRASVAVVTGLHDLPVDLVRCREDGPPKPAPAPILDFCSAVGVGPSETICVGDHAFDLDCARAAGAGAVLLRIPGNEQFEARADAVIDDLRGVLTLLGLDGHPGTESA